MTGADRPLFIRACVGGGVERYATDLASALGSDGDSPPVVLDASPPFGISDRARIARASRQEDVALVHSTHLQTPRVQRPVVVTIHDVIPLDHPESMPSPLRRLVFAALLRRSLRSAARVIAPSALTADSLMRRGAASDRIVVVREGASPAFHPVSEQERDEARARFAGGDRYVASIWNSKPHKNCAALVPLAEALRTTGTVLACAGAEEPTSTLLVSLGRLEDVDLRLFLGGAEAFVLPSVFEGFGLPALEAARCGTPVVCGRQVGCVEVLGEAVAIADPLDGGGLFERTVTFLEEDFRSDASAAITEAAARAGVSEMAALTREVYRESVGAV